MRPLRLFGHPLHPPLTHAPLGLLCTVPVWDVLALLGSGGEPWWAVARWTTALGLVLAVPAALTGLLDYLSLPAESDVDPTAQIHLVTALIGVGLGSGSLTLRLSGESGSPAAMTWAVGLSIAAALALATAGWYGAELTFGRGVGVRSESVADEAPPGGAEV